MDPIQRLLKAIDPLLIAPYRFFDDPMTGWWIGTGVLALWAVLAGELTMAAVSRINRSAVAHNLDRTVYYHEQSLKAKQAGDEKAYEGINRLANEAYGKSFFLMIAMGMAALWPAFFAAAWLQMRFGGIIFSLPAWAGGFDLNFLAPFIILYVLLRIIVAKARRSLSTSEGDQGPPG